MIKCEVIEEFTLEKFNELKNLVRANADKNQDKKLYLKDAFECDKELADYLTGDNLYKRPFVKVIEVIPEEVIEDEPKEEIVEKPKKAKRKK